MLFLLLMSLPSSFILFSNFFLSSSFLISSCEALRRRFFQRANSCHRLAKDWSQHRIPHIKGGDYQLSCCLLTSCQCSSSSTKLLYCSCMRSYRDCPSDGECSISSSLIMSPMLTLLQRQKKQQSQTNLYKPNNFSVKYAWMSIFKRCSGLKSVSAEKERNTE